jgi:putative endonuclease
MTNHAVGMQAEAQALAHLQGQGFSLIAQRYRNQWGEIDLVVSRADELRFVEVKARKSLEDGLYAVTPKQQQRIWQCAQGFIAEHPTYQQFAMQIDLIAIAGSQLQHETNILIGE